MSCTTAAAADFLNEIYKIPIRRKIHYMNVIYYIFSATFVEICSIQLNRLI